MDSSFLCANLVNFTGKITYYVKFRIHFLNQSRVITQTLILLNGIIIITNNASMYGEMSTAKFRGAITPTSNTVLLKNITLLICCYKY